MSTNEVDQTNQDVQNDYCLETVPKDKRRGLIATATVWIGWCISLSAFMTGGTIGAGCTAGKGVLAVLCGNLLLMTIAIFIGMIGYRTGLTTYSIGRIVFGKRGSIITSLLMGILSMGFIGVLLNSFGNAFSSIVPQVPPKVAIVVFAVLVALAALFGFKGVSIVSMIATPALWILLVVMAVATFMYGGSMSQIFSIQPEAPISFSTAMGAAIATWVVGAALVSDVTRYCKKPSHVIIGAFAGYILGAALFEGVAVISSVATQQGDFVKVMEILGLLIPAVIILALALWTTTNNNLYSSALAFTNLSELLHIKVSKPVWTLISIVIAIVVALLGLASKFIVWLNFIGTLMPPFAGILIAHFWIIHRDKEKVFMPSGFRWTALISWIAAIIVAMFSNVEVPAIIGSLAGIVIYAVLGSIFKEKENQDGEMLTIAATEDAPANKKA